MLSSYPTFVRINLPFEHLTLTFGLCQDNDMLFEQADKDFDTVFAAIRASRSLAASYSLQTDVQRVSYLPLSHS
jgi:hypothetical protein